MELFSIIRLMAFLKFKWLRLYKFRLDKSGKEDFFAYPVFPGIEIVSYLHPIYLVHIDGEWVKCGLVKLTKFRIKCIILCLVSEYI